MRYKVICLFMACVFSVVTLQPIETASAAELWNSRSGDSGSRKTYKRKTYSVDKDKKKKLYNGRGEGSTYTSNRRGSGNNFEAYTKVKMTGQTPSKLWGIMSTSAVRNRQSDIDVALRQEYNINKQSAITMTKVFAERRISHAINDKNNKLIRARYQEKQAAKQQDRLDRRANAINSYDAKLAKSRPRGGSKAKDKSFTLYNPYKNLDKDTLRKPKASFNRY